MSKSIDPNKINKKASYQFRDDMNIVFANDGFSVGNKLHRVKTVVILTVDKRDECVDTLNIVAEQYHGNYLEEDRRYSSKGCVEITKHDAQIRVVVKPNQCHGNSNRNDVREVAVCVLLAARLSGCSTYDEIASYIAQLPTNPGKRLKIGGSTRIEDVVDWLLTSRSDFDNSLRDVDCLIDAVGLEVLRNYEIHHKTKKVKQIRATGSRLSGINGTQADKWNPADFYLIKPDVKVTNICNSLDEYNAYISSNDDIIGISHKKSEYDACLGKAGMKEMVQQASNVAVTKLPYKDFDEEYTTFLLKTIKSLQNGCGEKLVIVVPKDVNSVTESVAMNAKLKADYVNKEKKANKFSSNYMLSVPVILNTLVHFNTDELLDALYNQVYYHARSEAEFSCPHIRLMGGKYEQVTKGVVHDIKLIDVNLILVKNTAVMANLLVDGCPMTIQCRSYNGAPAFEVKMGTYKVPNKCKSIKLSQANDFLK